MIASAAAAFCALAFAAALLLPRVSGRLGRMDRVNPAERGTAGLFAAVLILAATLPMGLSPVWNGEIPDHINQYELMADAFLSGHLYFQYDDTDPRLLAMENPYDAEARDAQGIWYHWDHAFYNGRYYMYFGAAPVALLFVPFRVLTGRPLTGYHATQLFTALHVAGLFLLLRLLARRFFPRVRASLLMLLSAAVSAMSVWYATATPALYCTAITGALAFAVWSLYFYARAVWRARGENRAILLASLGALCGALEFGCRPPIGLSNLLALPMLAAFLKARRPTGRLIGKLILAALPYAAVAAALMAYNAARFGNPLEFGQSYQLTVTDQSGYGDMLARFSLPALLHGLYYYLLNVNTPAHIISLGLFAAYPFLPVSAAPLLRRDARRRLRESGLGPFFCCLALSVLVIIALEVLWAPHPIPRYRMDFAWLLGIAAAVSAGLCARDEEGNAGERRDRLIGLLCLLAMAVSLAFALYPRSSNFTAYYAAEIKAFLGMQ